MRGTEELEHCSGFGHLPTAELAGCVTRDAIWVGRTAGRLSPMKCLLFIRSETTREDRRTLYSAKGAAHSPVTAVERIHLIEKQADG